MRSKAAYIRVTNALNIFASVLLLAIPGMKTTSFLRILADIGFLTRLGGSDFLYAISSLDEVKLSVGEFNPLALYVKPIAETCDVIVPDLTFLLCR